MTLFRNFAVLRQHYGNPFAPIQILTGDTREPCNARRGQLHDDGRSFPPKSRIERRFESSPESRGSANLWGTPRSFRTSEKNKPVSLSESSRFCEPRFSSPQWRLPTNKIKTFPGSSEVLQTSEQCTKNTFSHNPIKSFRRRRRHFVLLFVKYKKEDKKRFRLSAVSCCCRNIFRRKRLHSLPACGCLIRRGQNLRALAAPLRGAFPAGKLGSDRGK